MFSTTTRFENLLEAVPDALVGMDQKGVIRFVNRQTELLFGYDRDDLIGEPVEKLVPEPLWQVYASHRESYFADPRTRSSGLELELHGRHRNRTMFPVNISLSHIDTGDVLLVITSVDDVAKRKRAVKHVELISAIVEYSDDAIIGSTLEGVITSWNPAAEKMYGYSSREIIGRAGSLLVPEDQQGTIEANLDRLKNDQHVQAFETTRVRKDGSVVHVSVAVAPIHDEDGAIFGASAIHRDITEQRRAYEVAQRMEAIVESSDDAIIGQSLKGTVTSWNPAAERMYGYHSEEIVGKSIGILIPEDRAGEFFANLDRLKDGKHVKGLETLRVRKGGRVFPASVSLSPIHDKNGKIVGISAIHRDVTEQRRAYEIAQRMEAIVESSDDAIIGKTPEGIITSWNPAAETLYGYPSQEILGKPISILMHEDRRDEMEAILARIKAGQHVERIDTVCVRKDGSVLRVALLVSPIRDADGAIIGASAIARDVTEQRRAFEVAQRMEAIVASTDDAIIGQTLKGVVTSWNPAAARLYGYPSQEIIGQPISILMPEERRDEMEAILARIRAGRHVERVQTIRIRKDGTRFPISLTVSPICDPDGSIIGASGIGRDLTEQEHAVRYTRSLIEAGLDPLVTISPVGLIDDVNEATVKITGVPRETLIGSDYARYVTEPGKGREFFQQVFDQGSATDYPLTVRHRDGTMTDVLCNASVYRDSDGNVLGVLATGHDVTRRKEAFEAAQRMAAIVQTLDDAIIGRTLEGTITSWNPAAERMFGYSSGEIVGKPIELLTPPDRAGEARTVQADITKGQPVEHLETSRIRKDGTVVPVSLTVSPIRDEVGAVAGASVIARDMTEQRKVSAATRLAAAIEFSGEAIIATTTEGIVTTWNPAAERMFGYSAEEIIGQSDTLLLPQGRTREISDVMARIKVGERVMNYETVRARKDGSVFPISLTMTPIRDARGEVIGASSTPRDMTNQKEALAAAQHLAAIVEFSADAIISYTLEGVVTSWNPAAERMFGYTSQQIIGKSIEWLSPEGRTGEVSSILAMVKAGRPVEHHETMRVRKDGTAARVSLTVSPIRGAEGTIVGLSAIARDMTKS